MLFRAVEPEEGVLALYAGCHVINWPGPEQPQVLFVPPWISIEETPPPTRTDVIVYHVEYSHVAIGWFDEDGDCFSQRLPYKGFSHWMPLPEAP